MSESKPFHFLICDGPSCGVSHDSDALVQRVEQRLKSDPKLAERVHVWRFTCFGHCDEGPNAYVCPANVMDPNRKPARCGDSWPGVGALPNRAKGGTFYEGLNEEKILRVLEEHCGEGQAVEEWATEP
jgi:(2Fe-2S) ferredoxin